MTGTRDFNAAAATWDEEPGRVRMADSVARAIRETIRLSPEMDVLDFGCGTGLLTLRLQPFVRTITGIDTAPGMLAVLEKKVRDQDLSNVRAQLVDVEHGEVPAGKFDSVVSSMTFHHIRDVGPVIGRLAALIRPGGCLAVADLDSDEGKFHDSNAGVFHFGFDRCAMMKQFEAAGLCSIRNRTAAIVTRPSGTFTVFLMTGEKPR